MRTCSSYQKHYLEVKVVYDFLEQKYANISISVFEKRNINTHFAVGCGAEENRFRSAFSVDCPIQFKI